MGRTTFQSFQFSNLCCERVSNLMVNKLKPALIGGGAIGLLLVFTVIISSLPVPFVATIGCCKCLWPIAGGLLATMLYVKGSPTPVTILDGVTVGALAGVLGGAIYLFIGVPITYFMVGVGAMEMQMRQYSPDFPIAGLVLLLISGIVAFFIFAVLSTLGGLIGVPIFEKRKAPTDSAPPPQDVSGGAGAPGVGA
jgi:hypothetical protein